jgi:hypothetical protein
MHTKKMDVVDNRVNLKSHFNRIKFAKTIPEELRLNQEELDKKIQEQLPYFLVWLAKSRPITIK